MDDILFVCEQKDPQLWLKALERQLPEANIHLFPEIPDPLSIQFAICWKPKSNILDPFVNLKVIQSLGASVHHILSTQKLDKEVIVCKMADDYLSNDMFEYVLACAMDWIRNMPAYRRLQLQKQWKGETYRRIQATHIGLLGLGTIGSVVAKKLIQTGFKVSAWSNSSKTRDGINTYHGQEGLKEMLNELDLLVNLLPLTSSTIELINEKFLNTLPVNTALINVGRGAHIEEQALLKALDSGHLGYAYLDVFSEEPLSKSHPFWKHPKIQISPHIASLTDPESGTRLIVENFRRFKLGKELLHSVSKERGY